MNHKIIGIQESEYLEVVTVWEASVRATHHFLDEADIAFYRPLILNEYLKMLELASIRNDNNEIMGFIGIAEDKLEMLFIHPDSRSKGIGKELLRYAIEKMKVTKVDVNEENEQAIGFYKYFGFITVDRSAIDGQGKAYPLLHMELE